MEGNSGYSLCLVCCQAFANSSTNPPSIEDPAQTLNQFIQQTGVVNRKCLSSEGLLGLKQVSICGECLSGVEAAVERREEVDKAEKYVRYLQGLVLKAMRRLGNQVEGHLEAMTKLEGKINGGGENYLRLLEGGPSQGQGAWTWDDVFQFRNGIVRVTKEMKQFQRNDLSRRDVGEEGNGIEHQVLRVAPLQDTLANLSRNSEEANDRVLVEPEVNQESGGVLESQRLPEDDRKLEVLGTSNNQKVNVNQNRAMDDNETLERESENPNVPSTNVSNEMSQNAGLNNAEVNQGTSTTNGPVDGFPVTSSVKQPEAKPRRSKRVIKPGLTLLKRKPKLVKKQSANRKIVQPGQRKLWTKSQLLEALRPVKNKQLTVVQASKKYGIPRSTLYKYFTRGNMTLKNEVSKRRSVLNKMRNSDILDKISPDGKKSFECLICQKSYNERKTALNHYKAVHASLNRACYKCYLCPEEFTTFELVRQHNKHAHK